MILSLRCMLSKLNYRKVPYLNTEERNQGQMNLIILGPVIKIKGKFIPNKIGISRSKCTESLLIKLS